MNNQIANEKIKSLQYYLKTDKQGYVEISFENVAKVEAMIAHDSAYTRSFNKTSMPDEKWLEAFDFKAFIKAMKCEPYNVAGIPEEGYRGSSAFWFSIMKVFLTDSGWNQTIAANFPDIWKNWPDDLTFFKFIIYNAIAAIDAENSTRFSKEERAELAGRIADNREDFLRLLQNDDNNYELIDILCKATAPNGKRTSGRENFSFATKFCHYAAFYIFEGTVYQDNYSIFDGVVGAALNAIDMCDGKIPYKIQSGNLPLRAKGKIKWSTEALRTLKNRYHINYSDIYRMYQAYIDFIRDYYGKQTGTKVSRNGLDHLLWYYYKGRGAGLI
jgi:hypothetical protein